MKQLLLLLIRFYQKYLSFDRGLFRFLFTPGNTCRFTPTCSDYSYQAIVKYGIIAGGLNSLKRILRCHPWNPGGCDLVK